MEQVSKRVHYRVYIKTNATVVLETVLSYIKNLFAHLDVHPLAACPFSKKDAKQSEKFFIFHCFLTEEQFHALSRHKDIVAIQKSIQ